MLPKKDNMYFGKIVDTDGTKYRANEIQIHTPGKTQIIPITLYPPLLHSLSPNKLASGTHHNRNRIRPGNPNNPRISGR